MSIPTYYIGDKLVDETAGKVYLCTNVVGDYNRTFDYTWVTFDLTT